MDLTGEAFGRWTVVGPADDKVLASGYHEKMWHCICSCGTEKIVRGKSLRGGISKSCGCLQKEQLSERAGKHHGFGTRLYTIWNSMRQRCNNPHNRAFHNYGGRGIKICDEWDDYSAFRDWAYANGYDDSAKRGVLTIDRIDTDGNYCPDNCRFSDMRRQTNNRRETIMVEHNGVSLPLSIWAERLGVQYGTLWKRYKRGTDLFI